jgi:zinc-ribbon domain
MFVTLLLLVRHRCFLPFEFLGHRGVLLLVGVGLIVFLATSVKRPQNSCPKCGEINREQATFCAQCGTRLRDDA